MIYEDDMTDWVRNETGDTISIDDATVLQDLGVYGDDWDDLINAFARRFGVKMDNYRWYFHTREEGEFSIGGLLFPPPNRRVQRISVTVELLRTFANAGEWLIDYPEHEIPKRRYDILIDQAVVCLCVLGSVSVLIWKYVD
jgi:hypothetical protein